MQGLHILLADDLEGTRRLFHNILVSLRVGRVSLASDGEMALRMIDDLRPDILMCDWEMRPMNGLDLVRSIRSDPSGRHAFLPIVMVTAHSSAERVKTARDAGVTEFLAKPVTVRSVCSRIVDVCERPRPFLRTSTYFGPDRRRRADPKSAVQRRRRADRVVAASDTVEI